MQIKSKLLLEAIQANVNEATAIYKAYAVEGNANLSANDALIKLYMQIKLGIKIIGHDANKWRLNELIWPNIKEAIALSQQPAAIKLEANKEFVALKRWHIANFVNPYK